jgi:hypothetical protein
MLLGFIGRAFQTDPCQGGNRKFDWMDVPGTWHFKTEASPTLCSEDRRPLALWNTVLGINVTNYLRYFIQYHLTCSKCLINTISFVP